MVEAVLGLHHHPTTTMRCASSAPELNKLPSLFHLITYSIEIFLETRLLVKGHEAVDNMA